MPGPAPDRAVARWLLALWALVGLMVLVGGTTRLTGSGLSMVQWRPLIGVLPPLSESAWRGVFEEYQATPQAMQINHWMSLEDFRRIFFWEYLHRLLGRLLGLAFVVPFGVFWATDRLRGRWARVALAFVGGGAQGALGWWMVSSGLVGVPEVSHLRLAAHLTLAFTVGGWLLWQGLDATSMISAAPRRVRVAGWAGLALLGIQVLWGAFMAGTRAGHLSDTFPRMFGRWLPDGVLGAGLAALWSDPIVIHFVHRSLGWMVVGAALAFAARLHRWAPRRARLLAFVVLLQFALGVATVVLHVPIGLAVAHQVVAYALVSAWLLCLHVGR